MTTFPEVQAAIGAINLALGDRWVLQKGTIVPDSNAGPNYVFGDSGYAYYKTDDKKLYLFDATISTPGVNKWFEFKSGGGGVLKYMGNWDPTTNGVSGTVTGTLTSTGTNGVVYTSDEQFVGRVFISSQATSSPSGGVITGTIRKGDWIYWNGTSWIVIPNLAENGGSSAGALVYKGTTEPTSTSLGVVPSPALGNIGWVYSIKLPSGVSQVTLSTDVFGVPSGSVLNNGELLISDGTKYDLIDSSFVADGIGYIATTPSMWKKFSNTVPTTIGAALDALANLNFVDTLFCRLSLTGYTTPYNFISTQKTYQHSNRGTVTYVSTPTGSETFLLRTSLRINNTDPLLASFTIPKVSVYQGNEEIIPDFVRLELETVVGSPTISEILIRIRVLPVPTDLTNMRAVVMVSTNNLILP